MEVRLNIVLHDNQQAIENSKARFKIIKAGKRFGKSYWAIYAFIKMAFKKKGTYWFIGPTFSQVEGIAWRMIEELVPPELIRRKLQNKLYIELINGSILELKSADNPTSLRGIGIDGAVFDEAAYIAQEVWAVIVRGQLAKSKGPAYFISSPNEKGKNWYSAFYDRAKSNMEANDPDWGAWYFTIYDNPTLDKAEIKSIEDENSDDRWNLEYLAIESEYAGQLYHEFHVIENMEIKEYDKNLPLVEGIDWGIAHPTVCLWAQYDIKSKAVWVIDEFFKTGFVIEESCDWIKRFRGEKPIEWTVIDPSANRRDMTTGRTLRDEFGRNGVFCYPGDNRDRGYDVVRRMLKKRLLKIHPKCKNLLYQLKNLQYGDKEGDDTCLVAGTKVSCIEGLKNIEDITTEDYVLTRGGYNRVVCSSMTDLNADVYELILNSGKRLTGTANHPIFMSDGSIKKLLDIKKGEILFDSRGLNLIQLVTWKLRSYLKPFRNLTDSVTTVVMESISKGLLRSSAVLGSFIEKFGNTITEAYQPYSTFITKITIRPTIKSEILPLCPGQIIFPITLQTQWLKQNSESVCSKYAIRLQENGMAAQMEESFINGLENKCGKLRNGLSVIAIFVAENIQRLSLIVLNGVISIVKWPLSGQNAVVSVTRLNTKQSVFNLKIKDRSEFIANGFLVHNCDALRYMVTRIYDTAFQQQLPQEESKKEVSKIGEMSFLDQVLFPEKKKEKQNTFDDQIEMVNAA